MTDSSRWLMVIVATAVSASVLIVVALAAWRAVPWLTSRTHAELNVVLTISLLMMAVALAIAGIARTRRASGSRKS